MVLGPGPSAEELARRAADRPGLVCLRGSFAHGRPVLTSHPLRVLPAGERPERWTDPAGPGPDSPDIVGGGWFGVLGYDGAATRVAFHDHVVRLVDGRWHFEGLWTPDRDALLRQRAAEWAALLAGTGPAPAWTVGAFDVPDRSTHLAAVECAIGAIRAGELYQVNVCTRLVAPFTGSAAALFAAAAERLDPGYGALVTAPDSAVVCLSPELFVSRRGRAVRSAPIKGTLPDRPGNAGALRRSAKDVAENVMIVDLVRNDLGRVCVDGSVAPESLLQVVPHVGVLHLVSAVAGRLRPEVDDATVLDALFPPGSVTGAPKLSACSEIARLEPRPRGAYTGAVGFVSPCWGAEFAVAIRTFEIADGRIELGVGGGVTADSVPMLEWRECLAKAAPIVAAARGRFEVDRIPAMPGFVAGGLIETVLTRDGVPVRAADHLARLDRSLRELVGTGLPDGIHARVTAAARGVPDGRGAVRVVVRDGAVDVTAAPVGAAPGSCAAVVVPRADGLWRHKWADRGWAVAAEDRADGATPLFLGPDGAVLETTRGNVVVVEPDGALATPPLRDDLLPGVTRQALLDLARDRGLRTRVRELTVDDLRTRPAFWTSSLSGAVVITSLDGVALPRADELVHDLDRALQAPDSAIRPRPSG